MANRTFTQFTGTLAKGVVKLYCKVAFAGSTSTPAVTGKGVTSCAYNSATGYWLLTLDDKYNSLLGFTGTMYKSGAVPTASSFSLGAVDTTSAKTIAFYSLAQVTATNPGSTEVAYLEITLSNSSAS